MFNPQYDDARKVIARSQEQMTTLLEFMIPMHPGSGGLGLVDPGHVHQAVGMLAAEVHNIALALGHVIDVLDQEKNQ